MVAPVDFEVFITNIINTFYMWVIPATIATLTLFVILELRYMLRHRRIATTASAKMQKTNLVRRFTRFQMAEHFLLILSFTALSVTGLPQKYPDAFLSKWVFLVLGYDSMRMIHRVAAILMVVLALAHMGELIVRATRCGLRGGMIPTVKDCKDAWQQTLFYLNATGEQPRLDRFGFREKFEYFGVVWGSLIMIFTGIVLWRPDLVLQYLPGWTYSAALAAHGGEALLAVLVIAIWHMYNAIFRPDVFPLDKAMFTGYITEERLQHEHPLEYERMTEQAR